MNKKVGWTAVLVAAVVLVYVVYERALQNPNESSEIVSIQDIAPGAPVGTRSNVMDVHPDPVKSVPSEATKANPGEASSVIEFVEQESLRVGQTDSNPEQTQQRLNEFADQLSPGQAQTLFQTSLDQKISGDQRFLSAYILSLSDQTHVFDALDRLATAPISISPKEAPRLYEQEVMIRTQALEGLASLPKDQALAALSSYLDKIQEPLLIRHTQRLIAQIERANP